MDAFYQPVADLLARVAARRRRLLLARGVTMGAVAAALLLATALAGVRWLPLPPAAAALLGAAGALLAAAALVLAVRPALRTPDEMRLARFVEERDGTLEERLISAVEMHARPEAERPVFAAALVQDAARAAAVIDPTLVVAGHALRRAGLQAGAALLVLAAVIVVGRHAGRRAYDSAMLALFPARVTLSVLPGDARVEAGTDLRIEARLVGNAATVVPQLLRAEDENPDDWQSVEMPPSDGGAFAVDVNRLETSFQYRVVAGGAESPTFTVAVVRAPRVARIDIAYAYPKPFGLPPRREQDGGDIYAPKGTEVTVEVHTDIPASSGQMLLGDRRTLALAPSADGRTLIGQMTVEADDSYRVALADAYGLGSHGDTEYFIRTMDDRPPEVHVVRPASDRRVTPLEEVEIEAEAADDFGIASLDLVYSVSGGKEHVVPLKIPARETAVSASHLLYLEDLDLRPGDFISYYLRARDVPRGRRTAEVKSDIFFFEVKNFEEEFSLAQSQAAMGGGASNPQLDELVSAQKEVIVATWKLDRRAQASNAQSAQDIRAVAGAETELKARVERVATSLRTSVMRDPRAGRPRGGRGIQPRGLPGPPQAPQRLSEEDAMTAAAAAMGTAATALNALKTHDAIAPEMEALNRLLEAQADVRRREVQRQQAGNASGGNRATQDLSSLFDKELARRQETNYETRSSAETREAQQASAADRIRDLARRQDELLNRQRDLAARRGELSAEELKRELERLTREQNDLRQRTEEAAEEIARQQNASNDSRQSQQSQRGPQGQQQTQSQGQEQGQGQSRGQQSGQGQRQASGQGGQGQETAGQRRLREASADMRASADDLRREDTEQASVRGQRALDRLRELEQQLGGASAEGRRRAMGDLQLEARQLADAQRQIAAEQRRAGQEQQGQGQGRQDSQADARRRLAGEQERLAERLQGVQQRLRQQAQGNTGTPSGGDTQSLQQAAGDASREIARQRLAERMQQSAQAMREQGQAESGTQNQRRGQSTEARQGQAQTPGQDQGQGSDGASSAAAGTAQAQEEIARALERIADQLANGTRGRDAESQRLSEQRSRAQELRNRLNETAERLAELDRQASRQEGAQAGSSRGRDGQVQPSPGQGAPGQQAGDPAANEEFRQLRDEMDRQLSELRQLMDTARQDGGGQPGNVGRTFEGQGMVLSAPGTEGFKQDFARWQELKRQATVALESLESSAAQRLRAKESNDRLTAGADDRAPAAYQAQVDSYFKALASKKTP